MPDQKPPRLAGSEAETLRALLRFQRESLVRKVADLDHAAARWSPVGSHAGHADILRELIKGRTSR